MFELKSIDEIGETEWDKFVLSVENGSIHQITAWKKLQETVPTRGKVLGWAAVKNGEIKAVALLTRMKTGFLNTEWYYCGRGPVFTDESAATYLIDAVTDQLKKHTKAIFWRYDPYRLASDKPLVPRDTSTRQASAHYHPLDTSIVDLRPSADKLLAGLKKKRRYDIKQGLKNFQIRQIPATEVTDSDIDSFYSMLAATATSNGFSPHAKDYYKNFLDKLSPYTSLWLAETDGRPAAASILTICQDKAIYYFAAMTTDTAMRRLNPAHALLWSQIEYSQGKGAKTFDLLGIAPADQPDHTYAGITKFKTGFGGQTISYQPGIEVIMRPILYKAYRLAKAIK